MMDFPDYKDENGKVWTRYDIRSNFPESDSMRQQKLDAMAKKEGWSEYVQPDPYQDEWDGHCTYDCASYHEAVCPGTSGMCPGYKKPDPCTEN